MTTMTTWRVEVSAACIASGSCLGVAPKHFALGDDGRSHPTSDRTDEDDSILDAAASCPMEAITVHDTATGRRVEP